MVKPPSIPDFPTTAHDWDSFLIDKYDYGIWSFSFSIAKMIAGANRKYCYDPETEFPRSFNYALDKFMKKEIERRERLKTIIINTYHDSLCDWGWVEEGEPTEQEINFIKDIYKDAGSHLESIDKEIKGFKRFRPFWKKEGRPIELKNIIASVWAQILKDKRGSNWKQIEYLLRWFFNKFKIGKAVYYKALGNNSEEFFEYNIRHEYYVIKRNEHNRKNIEILRKIYFPLSKLYPLSRIEFKKDYINFPLPTEKGPLITFPDGETFQ